VRLQPRHFRPFAASDAAAGLGWACDIERGDEKRTVKVEVAATLDASNSDLLGTAREAMCTQGRSAVRTVLNDDNPPKRLIVTTSGVFWAD
jgi:hypothetical protein